jgi:hypothetical protein
MTVDIAGYQAAAPQKTHLLAFDFSFQNFELKSFHR